MRCTRSQELISLALDGPLPEYERSRLAEHLQSCPDCARHQELLGRGRELLQGGLVDPPENFEWKVQLGIQRALREQAARAERPVRGRFWLPATLSAAAVATLVLVAGSLWLEAPPATESGVVPLGARVAEGQAPDLRDAQPRSVPEVGGGGFGLQTVGAGGTPQRLPMGPVEGPHLYRRFRVTDENITLFREIQQLQAENELLRALASRRHIPTGTSSADSVEQDPRPR